MKETGLIFTGESVRAILEGRKTQTRRVMKSQPPAFIELSKPSHPDCAETVAVISAGPSAWVDGEMQWKVGAMWGSHPLPKEDSKKLPALICPKGMPGDRIWVKETFCYLHEALQQHLDPDPYSPNWWTAYRADGEPVDFTSYGVTWKSPIFMPRKFSRITLEITEVRIERLKDISDEDIFREGIFAPVGGKTKQQLWCEHWDAINKKRGFPWDANPWVWVIEFERLT